MKPTPTQPHLAPPGAGLPWPELQIARWIFRWQFRRTSREAVAALLREEATALESLVEGVPDALAARPVLIARLPGMEDSSRNWSLFMTLEHVAIVNEAVAGIINALGAGQVPPGAASTAAVKPHPDADASVLPRFRAASDAVRAAAEAVRDLRTASRFPHPWFGPLDAGQWFFMAAFHQRLHRRQMTAIRRGLEVG